MSYRTRRILAAGIAVLLAAGGTTLGHFQERSEQKGVPLKHETVVVGNSVDTSLAAVALETLAVKGRAPKTGYSRKQFGNGWQDAGNCDVRNVILARDMIDVGLASQMDCTVLKGTLVDPYTAQTVQFFRGPSSDAVQIDHVVALSDAWQKGAQQLSVEQRVQLANDPLELLAVDGPANQQKSDADAATWLPPNKAYRCEYVARQIAVKQKYHLWVTEAEKIAIKDVLKVCPEQQLPVVTVR